MRKETLPGLVLVTPPVEEPLSLDEARAWLRVDHTADDTFIAGLITAARELIEAQYDLALCTQTLRQDCRDFDPDSLRLQKSPVQSVSKIEYLDMDLVLQTLASTVYELQASRHPADIWLAFNQVWPVIRPQAAAVKITFVAGYGTQAAVPARAKAAIGLTIGEWYDSRVMTESLSPAVERLLQSLWSGAY